AADRHRAIHAGPARLLDRPPVVLDAPAPLRRGPGGEEAPAAQAGDGHPRIARRARAGRHPALRHFFPPEADVTDPVPRAAVHRLLHGPAGHRHLIEAEAPAAVRRAHGPPLLDA